ncbi:MAG: DUF3021 domain-containing protein [Oscillospiraceae bacterium]|nr:DUF3021 domain-containing protein [Oscillospiraceae bacterium]
MKKTILSRFLAGGIAGLLLTFAAAALVGWISACAIGAPISLTFATHTAIRLFGSYPPAALAQFLAGFCLGGCIGLATLPFEDTWPALLLPSILHFVMTGLCAVAVFWSLLGMGVTLLLYVPVYLLVWLARWVGWYAQVRQLRRALSLDPGPSVLGLREMLPWLGFAVVLCDILPPLLRLIDPPDVPVMTGLVLPWLLLPLGGFCSGFTLGKKQGFRPLYPVAAPLLYLPTVFFIYNSSALFHCAILFFAALLGCALGTAAGRKKK